MNSHIKWSLISGITISLFWAIYAITVGQIPTLHSVVITTKWIYTLPFATSYLWTIPLGIVLAMLTVSETKKMNIPANLAFGMMVGFGFGLGAGLSYMPLSGLCILVVFFVFLRVIELMYYRRVGYFGMFLTIIPGYLTGAALTTSVTLSNDAGGIAFLILGALVGPLFGLRFGWRGGLHFAFSTVASGSLGFLMTSNSLGLAIAAALTVGLFALFAFSLGGVIGGLLELLSRAINVEIAHKDWYISRRFYFMGGDWWVKYGWSFWQSR